MNFAEHLASVLPRMSHTTEILVGGALTRSLLTGSNESDQ
jgi:hypothetical protein